MFERVYLSDQQAHHHQAAMTVIRRLVDHFLERPDELPSNFRESPADAITQVVDYVAGMTDRFAIASYERLYGNSPFPASAIN
jgi:dGTPase